MSAHLFTLQSAALGGFYRSDFYVVAESFEDARSKIRSEFRRWLKDPDNAHHFDTVALGNMTTEDEAQAHRATKLDELEAELDNVKLATRGILIEELS